MKSPHDEKFRMIKKTNATIQKKLLSLQGNMRDLILDLGFIDVISNS